MASSWQRPPLLPPSSAARTAPASSDGTVKKHKQRRPRSLLLLLKSLAGLRVRIDLKNDCMIDGVVEEVLHDMDFTLVDATETKPNVRHRSASSFHTPLQNAVADVFLMAMEQGKRIHLDEVFVMGKNVLYVHIPDRINIDTHLLEYNRILRQSLDMYKRDKRKSTN